MSNNAPQDFTANDVVRLAGISRAKLRRLIAEGWVKTQEDDKGGLRFGFGEIRRLRALAALSASDRKRLGAAGGPSGPAAWKRDGSTLLIREGSQWVEPSSRQIALQWCFGEQPSVCALPSALARCRELFARALDTEAHDPTSAMSLYERVLELDPAHVRAALNLGRLLHARGDLESAMAVYRRALLVEPGFAMGWFNLGVALEDAGQGDRALEAYRRVLSIDANCADAHFNAARLCERSGDQVGALRHLRRYRALAEA